MRVSPLQIEIMLESNPLKPTRDVGCVAENTVSFHNFKPQNFKLSVSNPKSKYVAYLSVLSQISNCQGLGRKNKDEILTTDRILYYTTLYYTILYYAMLCYTILTVIINSNTTTNNNNNNNDNDNSNNNSKTDRRQSVFELLLLSV